MLPTRILRALQLRQFRTKITRQALHPRNFSARLSDTDELETRTQRDWFGRVFMTALPALPLEPISVGATWQTREQGEQDGTGPIYTVTALDPRHLELEASGDFGAYIGDRYDGYTVEATIDGTLRIDRQAAVPVDVDITMTGTITFAEAGELDPATTEPWESTFTLTAVEAPNAE